jgi:glutaredoxin-like protein
MTAPAPGGGRLEVGLAEFLRDYLPEPVTLVLFTAASAPTSREQQTLLEEFAKLSRQLTLEINDLAANREVAARYGVERAPCTIVRGRRDYGLRFYGVTAGHELATLLDALLMVSTGRSGLPPQVEQWVGRIDAPLHIEVFVTLTCPYCPRMVHVAYQMALLNDHVRADAVDTAEFPDYARRHEVGAVPLVVVNGRPAFHGLRTPEEAVLEIIRAAAPGLYEELEAELRVQAGTSHVRPPDPGHRYDLLVVGAGPAALAAALYAVRKGLDVLLIGERLGGQVADTASIENWPGASGVVGQDLALMFRAQVEHYRLAELLHEKVAAIERDPDGFVARVAGGAAYRGRAVVYCAGKQYRTLGVPGEERFLGRGIAFCATCDAPLFSGKRVVVVGGGNSAFTAARDLLPYATEIHLVNTAPDWQADAALQSAVSRSAKVTLHPGTAVAGFLGEGGLTGVLLEPAAGGAPRELPADGAFLEIGLTPNSAPVAALVPLNGAAEIPVNRDQSTAVPGFFAAGDVTDEPQKQIVVAAAAGAKAGLAAAAYLASVGSGPGP